MGGPGWFFSVVVALARGMKSLGFDYSQGHIPQLQARSLVLIEHLQKATNRCVSLTSMFLCHPPSFHSL